MPENECPINGITCVSLARVEALERDIKEEKEARSRSNEKIYDRLGDLERGMERVNTQYYWIDQRLVNISADLASIKEKPSKRWETAISSIITGVVGFILALVLKA